MTVEKGAAKTMSGAKTRKVFTIEDMEFIERNIDKGKTASDVARFLECGSSSVRNLYLMIQRARAGLPLTFITSRKLIENYCAVKNYPAPVYEKKTRQKEPREEQLTMEAVIKTAPENAIITELKRISEAIVKLTALIEAKQ